MGKIEGPLASLNTVPMFSRIPRYTPAPQACAICNCPADFEWLPCTDVCRQEERIDRLAPPPAPLAPRGASEQSYPPLPLSDDESVEPDLEDRDPFYEDRTPDNDLLMANAFWTVLDPCWPEYEHEIGYLTNFPHLIDEAQFIYSLLVRKPLSRDELVRIITELEPEGLFLRSYRVITWHLTMMQKAGIIYAQ